MPPTRSRPSDDNVSTNPPRPRAAAPRTMRDGHEFVFDPAVPTRRRIWTDAQPCMMARRRHRRASRQATVQNRLCMCTFPLMRRTNKTQHVRTRASVATDPHIHDHVSTVPPQCLWGHTCTDACVLRTRIADDNYHACVSPRGACSLFLSALLWLSSPLSPSSKPCCPQPSASSRDGCPPDPLTCEPFPPVLECACHVEEF